MTIKVTPEESNFIQANSSCVNDDWFYMPFWYHKVGENLYEMVAFENLPSHVTESIKQAREKQINIK